MAEVDAKALASDMKLAQSLYDARLAAIDEIVMERAFSKEAAAKGVSAEDLLSQKINEKQKPVTDQDVQAYYNANSARMKGKTLEQVSGQIKNFLVSQSGQMARKQLLDQVKTDAKVHISLEPPRLKVPIAANDPAKGSPGAKVTIVEFSDFQCPYCGRVEPTMEKISQTYGDQVRIVWRNFPLGFHANARPAAEAADCANAQGKFWEYHDKLFANQRALSADDLKKYAADVGLDVDAFNSCVASGKHSADVTKDQQEGQRVGVTGTPAFFVNGRFVSGAQPFEKFKELIDQELEN